MGTDANDTSVKLLKHIDSCLTSFGESLGCSDEYDETAKDLLDNLFRNLEEHFKNTTIAPASIYIGGSFGKNTDVIEPDLDVVILINNLKPPSQLNSALTEYVKFLWANEQTLKIRPSSFKTSDRSVTFCFTNGMSVDLLPAANVEDWDAVFKKMVDKKLARLYNPSRAKEQIDFMRTQEAFTHSLVRISKLWFKSLYLGENFQGGSSMMEVIAVAAAQKEIKLLNINEKRSISRAFRRILGMVRNLRTIKLAFCKANGQWKRVPGHRIRRNRAAFAITHPEYLTTPEMLLQKCFIIDPANPTQNFLEGKKSHFEKLNIFSRITQGRLDRILKGKGKFAKEEFILELFEPLPEKLYPTKSLALPVQYLVTSVDNYAGALFYLKVRSQHVYDDNYHDVYHAIEVLKQNLLTVVYSSIQTTPGTLTALDVKTLVANLITKKWQHGNNKTIPCLEKHVQADVTLQIPYEITLLDQSKRRCALFVSMNWAWK